MAGPADFTREQRRGERAIVLLLLGEREWWTRRELLAELDMPEVVVSECLADLERTGVVVAPDADRVAASPSARQLDALDLINN